MHKKYVGSSYGKQMMPPFILLWKLSPYSWVMSSLVKGELKPGAVHCVFGSAMGKVLEKIWL